MGSTYVVYSEEYYLSISSLRTILRKKIYTVSYSKEEADEVKDMMEEVLKKSVKEAELNDNNEMLTTYKIETICLDGKLTKEEAEEAIIDDDYTWGKVGNSK